MKLILVLLFLVSCGKTQASKHVTVVNNKELEAKVLDLETLFLETSVKNAEDMEVLNQRLEELEQRIIQLELNAENEGCEKKCK